MQAEPDVPVFQRPAAGDNAIGFMQVGEHQIEFALLLGVDYGCIQLAGTARKFGDFAPGCPAAIAHNLIIQPFRQRIITDVAQGKQRDPFALAQKALSQGQHDLFRSAAGQAVDHKQYTHRYFTRS